MRVLRGGAFDFGRSTRALRLSRLARVRAAGAATLVFGLCPPAFETLVDEVL